MCIRDSICTVLPVPPAQAADVQPVLSAALARQHRADEHQRQEQCQRSLDVYKRQAQHRAGRSGARNARGRRGVKIIAGEKCTRGVFRHDLAAKDVYKRQACF